MRNERSDENGGTCGNVADLARVELERVQVTSGVEVSVSEASTPAAVNILISGGGDSHNNQLETIAIVKLDICKDEKDEKSPKKVAHSRSQSYGEQCRVCQQPSDEALMELGCRCRGELAKAHKSCIELWFRTRGSNRCEICQQVAVNVPPPDSQPTPNYWVWRIDPRGGPDSGQRGRQRGCFNPLWIAFSILIGGLLLDVLISISLGISALPVNIIIGVLVVLGLGTALRLALECCHEWSIRRSIERAESNLNVNPVYPPVV
ncbi:uncharacterized protein LOC18436383 isoform X1 [Amborella trichopoda]|uniref:RING-CH-type domain-containing protein n=1 Tax=Amborella trichopoda TaxID=13333 RepID=W1PDX5_AMBTC|nr:uncharacterized protein LOC18436383 isoform X1 [Amborella trichopoda]ERN08142.1 hypothetical protein AMTR_s00018p00108930 [Amborella trichopoda]|eukprot:XP_006846467.1 uncharacterized protein LOC18436383 isoform X1 [Amborella trichopoda]